MKKLIEKLFEENIWFTCNWIIVSIFWVMIIFGSVNQYLNFDLNWSNYLEVDNKKVDILSFIESKVIDISGYIEIAFGVVGKFCFYIFLCLFFAPLGAFFLIWPIAMPIIVVMYFIDFVKRIFFNS